jgi:hypothetical protein
LHLAQRALEAATAAGVHLKAETVHSLNEQSQATRVRRYLSAQECLVGHGAGKLSGNEEVGLVAKLLNKFVSSGRFENVIFNGNVLVIELLEQTLNRDVRYPVTEASLTEFAGSVLYIW